LDTWASHVGRCRPQGGLAAHVRRGNTRREVKYTSSCGIHFWAREPRRAAFAGAAPFTASRVVHRGAGPVRHWVRWGDTIAISAAILLLSHKLSSPLCGCWAGAVGLNLKVGAAAFLGGCHVRAYQLNAHYAATTSHATGSFGAAPTAAACMRPPRLTMLRSITPAG